MRALLPRLHYFQEGTCIVHHIFGGRVTEMVAAAYSDAFLTAHFEVIAGLMIHMVCNLHGSRYEVEASELIKCSMVKQLPPMVCFDRTVRIGCFYVAV